MIEHPLHTTLLTAGESSRTVARNLSLSDYTICPDGIAPDTRYAMSLLAEALVQDATGHAALTDRHIVNDRVFTNEGRTAARNRNQMRATITDALTGFSRDFRVWLIDQLAAGQGAQAAKAMQTTATAHATARRDGMRAEPAAVTTA